MVLLLVFTMPQIKFIFIFLTAIILQGSTFENYSWRCKLACVTEQTHDIHTNLILWVCTVMRASCKSDLLPLFHSFVFSSFEYLLVLQEHHYQFQEEMKGRQYLQWRQSLTRCNICFAQSSEIFEAGICWYPQTKYAG